MNKIHYERGKNPNSRNGFKKGYKPFWSNKKKKKLSETLKKKIKFGWKPEFCGWNKGLTKETDERVKQNAKSISISLNGKYCKPNPKYSALHTFIRKNKPKPELCEICNKKPPRELANVSGLYKRNILDYKYLCKTCHYYYNRNTQKLKIFNQLKKRVRDELEKYKKNSLHKKGLDRSEKK
jgi:hypothetical protein